MRNYVIINGVNSLTIPGLAIKSLPPITKPIQRTLREEIDGRDGDIITELGYGAYDKEIEIGLFGDFDVDQIIAYFNQKGTITFSNEPDKVYYFQALNQVDYEELIKFREAGVTLHCQPFKYPVTEEPLIEEYEYVDGSGESITLDNTAEETFTKFDLLGNTSQTGTPTPSSPIPVNVVSGDNEIVVSDKMNLFNKGNALRGYEITSGSTGAIGVNANWFVSDYIEVTPNTEYTFIGKTSGSINVYYDTSKTAVTQQSVVNGTFTLPSSSRIKYMRFNAKLTDIDNVVLIKGTGTYQGNTYNIDLPIENLLNLTNEPIFSANASKTFIEPRIEIIKTNTDASAFCLFEIGNASELNGKNLKLTGQCLATGTTNGKAILGYADANGQNRVSIANSGTLGNTNINISMSVDGITYATKKVVLWLYGDISQTGSIGDTMIYENIMVSPQTGAYTPYGTTPIELCKIGNYQDYIYKDSDKWYLHKEIGKVVLNGSESWGEQYTNGWRIDITNLKQTTSGNDNSYVISNYYQVGSQNAVFVADYGICNRANNSQIIIKNKDIANLTNFKTWLSTHNTTVYYILATPTNTEITYQPLIEQLNTIEQATSKRGQTNITQTNNGLPFFMIVSAMKLGSDVITIPDDGNIYSKPTIKIEGTGIVDIYLNDVQEFEVDLTEDNEITIDTEKMEAYTETGLANRKVTGDYSKFKLQPGDNEIRFSGDLSKATITRYTRWL